MRKNKIWTIITILALIIAIMLGYLFLNQKNAYAQQKRMNIIWLFMRLLNMCKM